MWTRQPQLESPAPDELEISILGPGYGESVVLHIGNGQWILVDSCLEPNSTRPAPLRYLHALGVDIEQSVRLVVATHWHDDHIRGISAVLSECKSAKLVISDALLAPEFLKLVGLYTGRVMDTSSGVDEFVQVFRILEARKQQTSLFNPPSFASSDRLLYRGEITLANNTVEARVFSLSPSDASKLRASLGFVDLLPAEGERKKRITSLTPNHASIVLWVQVGDHKLLLGADLERTSDSKMGWSVILDDSTVISGKAGVFKVAHHGAESAHEPRVWSELLSEDPYAIMSPFRRGNKHLPTTADINRIDSLTPNAYITSRPTPRRHRWPNRVVRDLLREATRDIQNVHQGWGRVRLRQRIAAESNSWQVELFGDAVALRG